MRFFVHIRLALFFLAIFQRYIEVRKKNNNICSLEIWEVFFFFDGGGGGVSK